LWGIGACYQGSIDTSLITRSDPPQPSRPRPTALLPSRSDGIPEAATAVVVAPDDGHGNARNMLSCI
jgi:hypothetical protein